MWILLCSLPILIYSYLRSPIMLGAFRRFGVVHAVRAASPQALSVRSLPQRVQWRSPSIAATPRIACSSFHSSSTFLSAAAEAQAQPDVLDSAVPSRLTHFSQLAEQGLVDPEIIRTINQRMKIQTMTDVQSMTIQDILQGGDVYVDFYSAPLSPPLVTKFR